MNTRVRTVNGGLANADVQQEKITTYLAIVSNKGHAVTGIHRTTAEIANTDSHIDRVST